MKKPTKQWVFWWSKTTENRTVRAAIVVSVGGKCGGGSLVGRGVEVLPWMLCGTDEIGAATAEKMHSARLVVWAMHGIYGAGKALDETFGLIETAEKAAEIYMLTASLPRANTITDAQLLKLADFFSVTPRPGILTPGEEN